MGKGEELTTTKYLIHAQINANGIVEKPDVVGAVFGQTEGLLSNDLDLRELQRTGRIGRIQVNIHSNSGRAKGEIVIVVAGANSIQTKKVHQNKYKN